MDENNIRNNFRLLFLSSIQTREFPYFVVPHTICSKNGFEFVNDTYLS